MERPKITVAMPGDAAGDSLAGRSGQGIAFDGGWAGVVRLDPGSSTTWHHHGDSESIGFVISGAIRIESEPGGNDAVEAMAGQLVHIPRFFVHRESTVGTHETTLVVVRLGTEGSDNSGHLTDTAAGDESAPHLGLRGEEGVEGDEHDPEGQPDGDTESTPCLKRDYGWRRTRIDGTAGTETWCAWGVLAHNATKISGLINAEAALEPANQTKSAPPGRQGTGPPGRQRAAPAA